MTPGKPFWPMISYEQYWRDRRRSDGPAAESAAEPFPPPFVLVHKHGSERYPPCGYPAYYLTRKPEPATVASSRDARYLDGARVKSCAVRRCGTCGRPFPLFSADVYPVVQS